MKEERQQERRKEHINNTKKAKHTQEKDKHTQDNTEKEERAIDGIQGQNTTKERHNKQTT